MVLLSLWICPLGGKQLTIEYNGPTKAARLKIPIRTLSAFSDADFATDTDDRKSRTGYVLTLNGGAVAWKSNKQATVALSTLEAEYMAMSRAAQEVIHVTALLEFFEYGLEAPITVYGDNQACNSIAKDPKHHDRVKHVDIRHHFLRERVQQKQLIIEYVDTHLQLADGLTKAVNGNVVETMWHGIGMLEE